MSVKCIISYGVSLFFLIIGTLPLSPYQGIFFNIGCFSLSGAFTNWLAIYMLFEKIPFLYGSGIIPNKFQEFQISIKKIMMNFFFNGGIERMEVPLQLTKEIKGKVLSEIPELIIISIKNVLTADPILGKIMSLAGTDTLTSIEQGLKEKIIGKLSGFMEENMTPTTNIFEKEDISAFIEKTVDEKISLLTPHKVKHIVSDIIKSHLDWLVVWGAVFGGLIGLMYAIINLFYLL